MEGSLAGHSCCLVWREKGETIRDCQRRHSCAGLPSTFPMYAAGSDDGTPQVVVQAVS